MVKVLDDEMQSNANTSEAEREQVAMFTRITHTSILGTSKWLMPGMSNAPLHWQWHAVFAVAMMSSDGLGFDGERAVETDAEKQKPNINTLEYFSTVSV